MRCARSAYPNECAGIVVRTADGALSTVPCPKTHTATDNFELPASMFWSTHQNDQRIVAFYHSHPNGSAALSTKDQKVMLAGESPAWPNVDWYVIPLDRKRVKLPVRYTWSKPHQQFVKVGVQSCN